MKILLLNGPPNSGKDEVLKILVKLGYWVYPEKFAKPLRAAVCGLLGIEDAELEDLKRKDHRVRQLMIGISQLVAKPTMGQDFFAKSCAERIAVNGIHRFGGRNGTVITDCGFQHELDSFIEHLQAAEAPLELELWSLYREGCSFSGDSRERVILSEGAGKMVNINNYGTLDDLQYLVGHLARQFFGHI
jgi:hypothetical protein